MIAFALCVVLTPLVKKIAAKRGWMAYPVKDRWHKQPTALMGGIAIYAAMHSAVDERGFCLYSATSVRICRRIGVAFCICGIMDWRHLAVYFGDHR